MIKNPELDEAFRALAFNIKIFVEQEVKKSEKKEPKELEFLRNCPHYLSDECKSVSWNLHGPCGRCVKAGKYNAVHSDEIIYLTEQVAKESKCR